MFLSGNNFIIFYTIICINKREFENLAIGILDVYDQHTTDNVRDVLVIRYLDFIEMDCLELAVDCKCERFLAHRVVQKTMDELWKGESLKSTSEVFIKLFIFYFVLRSTKKQID